MIAGVESVEPSSTTITSASLPVGALREAPVPVEPSTTIASESRDWLSTLSMASPTVVSPLKTGIMTDTLLMSGAHRVPARQSGPDQRYFCADRPKADACTCVSKACRWRHAGGHVSHL